MGRAPGSSKFSSQSTASSGACTCCSSSTYRRGPWTAEEDELLSAYMLRVGTGRGNWRKVPKEAGLLRCGKSCRLRWLNYLRPDLKRGSFSEDEEDLIVRLHSLLGNRWSLIAGRIPGRSDNEIKNYWNFHLSKKLRKMGIDPKTHRPLQLEVARQVPCLTSPISKEDESKTPDLNNEKSLSPWSPFSSTTSSVTSPCWDLDGALEELSQDGQEERIQVLEFELGLASPVVDDWIFNLFQSTQPQY